MQQEHATRSPEALLQARLRYRFAGLFVNSPWDNTPSPLEEGAAML